MHPCFIPKIFPAHTTAKGENGTFDFNIDCQMCGHISRVKNYPGKQLKRSLFGFALRHMVIFIPVTIMRRLGKCHESYARTETYYKSALPYITHIINQ